MNANELKWHRPLLILLTLSSATGISIWYVRRLLEAGADSWFTSTVTTFSFFTNLTNLIVVIMGVSLLFGRGRLHQFFSSASVQSAVSLYIAFVGLGFWILLGGPGELVTWDDWVPEITAHSLSPILGFLFWLVAVPKGKITWKSPLLWLIYPICYLIFWLLRGPLVGYYPYFFVDVNALGYSGVALWSSALVMAFLILGMLMLMVDRRQSANMQREVVLSK